MAPLLIGTNARRLTFLAGICPVALQMAPLSAHAQAVRQGGSAYDASQEETSSGDGATAEGDKPLTAWEASRARDEATMVATGVATARDRLDSATSTSTMIDNEISKTSATSLGDLFRNIPGIRAEASAGEGNANYTIRGLPLVSTGAKYLQFQEDGLPVLEFGDILGFTPDVFMRADLNIAQIESIRGGSASTFASNAPGGVINLISHTGEVEGGSVQGSAGLDHESYRLDFDYGGRLSETLRFHLGGFYREGAGPRHVGYTGERGGQVKFNVTKEISGGYLRFYGKLLDDHNSSFSSHPVGVSGTNSHPRYDDLPGFSLNSGSALSRNISTFPVIDGSNALSMFDLHDGNHIVARSFGFEGRFHLGGWSVFERMRYADQSGTTSFLFPIAAIPAMAAAPALGAAGGRLVYASGPLRGHAIANPLALNGNGLTLLSAALNTRLQSLDNFNNDLRASRVWSIGTDRLTSTVGVYLSRQEMKFDSQLIDILQDVRGGGKSALLDVIKADGTLRTQGGVVDFTGPTPGTHSVRDIRYRVIAPYGSINLQLGKLALGGSIRLDTGKVEGEVRTNTPFDVRTIDVNADGVISDAERTFAFAPVSNTTPVDYSYHYVSYSGSVNYRVTAQFSAFARYSRGARAAADRILLSPAISPLNGGLVNKIAAYDPVKQAEVGLKYRNAGLFINITGFWANASETNTQLRPDANGTTTLQLVNRSYRAYGAEFEGGLRHGPFSLTAGATVTDAKIIGAEDAALRGRTPRHQAALIFQIMPQYESGPITIGANIIGSTKSFAQDENVLRIPGYETVNTFIQFRPIDRVVLSLNISNLFDTSAITDVAANTIPATGVVLAQSLYGRTVTGGFRYFF